MIRSTMVWAAFCILANFSGAFADPPSQAWWPATVESALGRAQDNRKELEVALAKVPKEHRDALAFLLVNMPDSDLKSLKSDFLLTNIALAYQAKSEVPWGKEIPESIFFNNVLPYANVDEKRDAWRKEFYDLCMPIAKQCKTPTEVVKRLNSELFAKLKLGYSTQRKAPNQSPKESIEQGKASCTGLSIVLSDACRSVGIPARLVGTAMWADKRGNHTWVEIWDKDWHFTGACEPDPLGLDRGWFVGDASKAIKDSPLHAIYATSFQKTESHFPLVWAKDRKDVPGVNVTDRYAKPVVKVETVQVFVKVLGQGGQRIAAPVTLVTATETTVSFRGTSKGETADTNDFLTFELKPNQDYTATVNGISKSFRTGPLGKPQTVEIVVVP